MKEDTPIDKAALEQFESLSTEDWKQITDLNARIQSHTGTWGQTRGDEKTESGEISVPYVTSAPLIYEFTRMWYDKNLVVLFNWSEWTEGREWYAHNDPQKYDILDAVTALKLLTAILRYDRFSDGALMGKLASGDFPKIINRLVQIHEAA